MALTNETGNTGLPTQLGQGQSILQQYGVGITGGSTVLPSTQFAAQPGTPMSTVYLGRNFDRSLLFGDSSVTGKVYDPDLGSFRTQTTSGTQGPYAPGYDPNRDSTSTDYETAKMIPLTWSEAEKRDFISKGILYKVPGFDADMGMPEVMSAWDDMVRSAQAFSTDKSKWSPYDVMESYAKDPKSGTIKSKDGNWLLDAATGEKIKYIGPKTKTTTDKKIDLSSAEDVKAITTQMLTELLGRAPTAAELASYKASINQFEGANPLRTVTTSHLDDMGEITSQDTTSSGGVSAAARQQLVQDSVTGTSEFGKYQSGTTYFNALLQMLGG